MTPAQYVRSLDDQQILERYAEALRVLDSATPFHLTPGDSNYAPEIEARDLLAREMVYRGIK